MSWGCVFRSPVRTTQSQFVPLKRMNSLSWNICATRSALYSLLKYFESQYSAWSWKKHITKPKRSALFALTSHLHVCSRYWELNRWMRFEQDQRLFQRTNQHAWYNGHIRLQNMERKRSPWSETLRRYRGHFRQHHCNKKYDKKCCMEWKNNLKPVPIMWIRVNFDQRCCQ